MIQNLILAKNDCTIDQIEIKQTMCYHKQRTFCILWKIFWDFSRTSIFFWTYFYFFCFFSKHNFSKSLESFSFILVKVIIRGRESVQRKIRKSTFTAGENNTPPKNKLQDLVPTNKNLIYFFLNITLIVIINSNYYFFYFFLFEVMFPNRGQSTIRKTSLPTKIRLNKYHRQPSVGGFKETVIALISITYTLAK